jgi:putative hydrolase of the HAD superfamily
MQITTIGFDADDTLWHNETFYRLTQEHFWRCWPTTPTRDHLGGRGCWRPNGATSAIMAMGSKGFTLSMIETAIEVTEGRVPASVIAEIWHVGREMLAHPVDLLPHAREAVAALRLARPPWC